jgi:glucose-1-phosphate adenylyltransferase
MNNLHGILFAYRSTPELKELTLPRTLASLPFGGRYRVIDFMLSNMVNAGITDVGVIMHESYQSLLDHLGSGKDWDLARKNGGLKLLPPFAYSANDRRVTANIYRGTMEALGGVYSYLKDIRQEYVVLADAHTIVNINFKDVLAEHIASGADITAVCTTESTLHHDSVSRNSIYFTPNEAGRVTEVLIGPAAPSGLESLNIYVLSKKLLLELTEYCAARDIYSLTAGVLLPRKDELNIRPYLFNDYANRIQTVAGYYHHNMELLDPTVRKQLFAPERPIRTKERADPATYYAPGSKCVNCVVADGCVIEGTVENSIIFHGTHIAKGAVVRNCVVMQSSEIQSGADIEYIITDKNVTITAGTKLMGSESYPMVVAKNTIV